MKSWILPIATAGLIFVLVKPVLANLNEPVGPIIAYEEVRDGFSSIYYMNNGEKTFVSPVAQNSKSPDAKGNYIVWITEVADRPGQVFRHDIASGLTLQITNSGVNRAPKVSETGQVVWEGWVEDRWQVFFFDGIKTEILTSEDASFNPLIIGDNITFTRQDVAGTYRSVVYSISKKVSKDISTGISSKNIKIEKDKIFLNGEEFPLTISDLFLLDFKSFNESPTPQPEVNPQDILEEIDSVSSFQTPVSTQSAQLEN